MPTTDVQTQTDHSGSFMTFGAQNFVLWYNHQKHAEELKAAHKEGEQKLEAAREEFAQTEEEYIQKLQKALAVLVEARDEAARSLGLPPSDD